MDNREKVRKNFGLICILVGCFLGIIGCVLVLILFSPTQPTIHIVPRVIFIISFIFFVIGLVVIARRPKKITIVEKIAEKMLKNIINFS